MNIGRILILKLGAIGDVVHSLPVLETLRARFPKAYIAWVVEEAAAPVLRGNPHLDEVIVLERRRLKQPGRLGYFRNWLGMLKEKKFDTVVDLHNLFKTGFIGFFSGAPVRIGFRRLREGNFIFNNKRVEDYKHYSHAVEKYLSLLGPVGIKPEDWVVRFPLQWTPEEEKPIQEFWGKTGWGSGDRIVVINPGASWVSKRWSLERYSRTADFLIQKFGVQILLLWGPGEKHMAEGIASGMENPGVIACETSLRSLPPMLKRCRLLISGDTGPLHLAAALGVSTVSLFGPSRPKRNGPYGEGHTIVESTVPPATHWQNKEVGDEWMKGISVDRVIEAASGALA